MHVFANFVLNDHSTCELLRITQNCRTLLAALSKFDPQCTSHQDELIDQIHFPLIQGHIGPKVHIEPTDQLGYDETHLQLCE